MDGKGSRGKGARGEREVVSRLIEMGVQAEKLSRSGYTGADIVVNGRLGEVKRQESMSKRDWDWLDQNQGVDFLFKRVNGKEWLVVMDLETFVKMLP